MDSETPDPTPDPRLGHLDRLAQRRGDRPRDESMAFVTDLFHRQVARPYRQLEGLGDAWERVIPAELLPHCRLESLLRGVLTVAADSSATLYRLDALVRDGLAVKLAQACKGKAIRRIRLRVDTTLRKDEDSESDEFESRSNGARSESPPLPPDLETPC